MPSLIPGYAYDIFISYRQKDNKYDGWVTEFVSNLRKELEATFKEDISIYFDENPHDGLLETHDVDESLKDKLKCLIFIPIISQTYCDPNSFAWKHEFLVFKKLASEDDFGLKVKLNNGNVASRILPVRIHELYVEDMNTIEAELGGPLRAIDFVYKSPGVNRPLTAQDNPDKNLDKTLYRDQINKVANAVKELIFALQNKPTLINAKKNLQKPVAKFNRLWLLSFIPLILIVVLIFSFWHEEEVSIAVLPFRNISQVKELEPLGIGMASEIRTKLSLAKRFKFISALQATLPYENTSKSIPDIGNELGVSYILSGLIQQRGDQIKVETELIDAKNGREIWSLSLVRELADINLLQIEIAEKVIKQFSSNLTVAEKNKLTSNVVAYAHYAKGNLLLDSSYGDSTDIEASYKVVIEQYEKAIELDSLFMDAWADLIGVETFIYRAEEDGERRKNRKEKIDRYCQYFNKRFPDSWQKDLVQGHYAYRVSNERAQAIAYYQQVLEVNPENIHALYALSTINKRKLELDLALKYAIRLIEQNPSHGGNWMNLSGILSIGGEHEKSARAAIKGWNLSRSKNFGKEAVVKSLLVGLPERELPLDLKEKLNDDWRMFSLLMHRDWVALKKYAYEKRDYGLLSETYMHLAKLDSAIYYWNEQSELQKGNDSVDYFILHKDVENALRIFRKSNLDRLDHEFEKLEGAIRLETEISIYVSLSEVEKATELLHELSNRYPQYNDYLFYKSYMFDNIKSYPPFQKRLDELLQRKSTVSVNGLMRI